MLNKIWFSLSLFILVPIFLMGYTVVNGDVSGQTWSGGVYVVTSGISVSAGSTLTINNGTVVKFQPGQALSVNGQLNANGAIFTSWYDDAHGGDTNADGGITLPTPNQWSNVSVTGSSSSADLEYCEFWYGANGTGNMLYLESVPAAYVGHCSFRYSQNYGLYVNNSNPIVENCTFNNNINNGLHVYNCGAGFILRNCSFDANNTNPAYFSNTLITQYDGITVTNQNIPGFKFENCTISGYVTWSDALKPVVSGLTIPATATLEVLPGTVIKCSAGSWNVQGTLISTGTAAQPIVYTSIYDDAHGGDTNGDGGVNLPAPNQWGGFSFNNTTIAPHLEYCEFWYGSYGIGYMVYMESVPDGYIGNCSFRYSQNYGLWLNFSNPVVENCTFGNNINNGLRVTNATASLILRDCTFDSNNTNPAYFSGSAITQYNGITITNHNIPGFRFDNCTISGHVVWSNVLKPYVCGLIIPANATLEILPGTVIKGIAGSWSVQGTLITTGTASQPIIFTSYYDDAHGGDSNGDGGANLPTPNQWGGLSFTNTSINPHLEYCEFWYGAYGTGYMVYLESVNGYIGNCAFRYSQNYGLWLNYSNPIVENCTFGNNVNNGLRVTNANASFILRDCSFDNNTTNPAYFSGCVITQYNGIAITNHNIPGFRFDNCTVSGHITWSNVLKPYVNGLTIPAAATLEILPGTVIKNSSGSWSVQGTLITTGTDSQPIIYTSYYDDAHGGDTNGDNGANLPAPNQWGGLSFTNTTVIPHLEYCEFWYGAYVTNNMVYMESIPNGYIGNCTFRYSQNYGMWLNYSNPTVENCTFGNNINVGLRVTYADASFVLRNCNFHNNWSYPAYFSGSTISQYDGLTVTNQAIQGFRYDNCTVSGYVVWNYMTKPFVSGINIPAASTLEILPGTVVKNYAGSWNIQGHLFIHGVIGQPIVFTSFWDDAHGGDTDGDNGANPPAPNQWGGLYYNNTAIAPELDYCEFWYGAYVTGSLLYMDSVPGGLINHCTFRYSQNMAIQVNNSSPMIDDCLIRDNLSHGIYVINSSPTIRRCRIQDNNGYGILIQGSTSFPQIGNAFDLGYNYFGHNNYTGWQIYNQTANTISAMYNTWDWTNPVEIDAHVYDNEENPAYGEVIIAPVLVDTPAAPENVSATYGGNSVVIIWNPVTTNTIGNLINVSHYRIEAATEPYSDTPVWFTLGTATGTSFSIDGTDLNPNLRFFRVYAIQ